MNNNFQVREYDRKYPNVKIFELTSDNGFIKRNSYFFKERIQIICMK